MTLSPVPTTRSYLPSPPASDTSTPPQCETISGSRLKRHALRAVLMRAGTSRGLFLRLEDLPLDRTLWRPALMGAMGSPDGNLRQLDGVGGGYSTSSKVAIVSKSTDPRADVDYLFVQVPVDGSELDFSGNCGNMASGVGPFAVDEGLVGIAPQQGLHEITVKIRNVNTDRLLAATFWVEDGRVVEDGTMRLDGISSASAPIRLDFLEPGGSMTGRLLPTGKPIETLTLQSPEPGVQALARTFHVSCVDAANPMVFVLASDLGLNGTETDAQLSAKATQDLMTIRAQMAVRMGLAKNFNDAASTMGTPKIAIVGPPVDYYTPTRRLIRARDIDILVRAFSMGRPHPTIQMTGAICLGAAAAVSGTLVETIVTASRLARKTALPSDPIVIGHAGGTICVSGESEVTSDGVKVKSGSLFRTARRLMEGKVFWMG